MSQKELLIEKFEAYKKLYNESKDDFEPLRNNDDITFIENLIKTNNFAVVPVYKENKITKFYTVGLWYFFNVPELVINLENIVLDNENDEYINMIFDIIVSRDHGPGNLEYSKKWGSSRLFTGFHSSSSGSLPRFKKPETGNNKLLLLLYKEIIFDIQ